MLDWSIFDMLPYKIKAQQFYTGLIPIIIIRVSITDYIWAETQDFQQCGILTCVDSDEYVQSPFKLRNSKWCSLSSLSLIEFSSE